MNKTRPSHWTVISNLLSHLMLLLNQIKCSAAFNIVIVSTVALAIKMLSIKLLSWLSYLELCLLVQKALKPTAMAHETKMNLTKYCARTRSKHIGSQLAEHSAHDSLNSCTSTNTWDALHCRVFSTCSSQIVFQRMQCKKGVSTVLCND